MLSELCYLYATKLSEQLGSNCLLGGCSKEKSFWSAVGKWGAGLPLSGDMFGRSHQVHSESLGFADKGADSTAPALPGIDDSL